MAYILQARPSPGELPRMVWMESADAPGTLRIIVATAAGTVASGTAHLHELERVASGPASCVCSGQIWLEQTADARLCFVSFTNQPDLPALEIPSFDFSSALQRLGYEALSMDAAATLWEAAVKCADLTAWEDLATTRGITSDR